MINNTQKIQFFSLLFALSHIYVTIFYISIFILNSLPVPYDIATFIYVYVLICFCFLF